MSDHQQDEQAEPGQFVSEGDIRGGLGGPKSAEDAVERRLDQEGSFRDTPKERLEATTRGVISMMGRLVQQLHLSGKLDDAQVVEVLGGDFREATSEEVAAYAVPQRRGPGPF